MRRRLLPATVLLLATPWMPAAPTAEPWIAVIMPAGEGAPAMDAETLALVFRRRRLYGADGSPLQPVNLPAGSPLRRQFSLAILRQAPEALEDYWDQLYFQGILPPHVLESEAAVLRFVAETPHAVGYLAACSADARVRVVLLIDPDRRVLPGSGGGASTCASPPP